jgi:hypothetical protein
MVKGLIAKQSLLERFASRHSLHAAVALPANLAMLPLRDKDLGSFLAPPFSRDPEAEYYLSGQFLEELAAASHGSILMYFETEYFGGVGAQAAAVFRDGELVFGPESGKRPINHALKLLGVQVTPPAHDEFEALGLHRRRSTEEWLRG